MNRRNFFTSLIKGVGVFSILPPAETYARIWKASRQPVFYGCWTKTECVDRWVSADYLEWLEKNSTVLSLLQLNPNLVIHHYKDKASHIPIFQHAR